MLDVYYTDADKGNICTDILNIEDTAENRAMVDSVFVKDEYVYMPDTNRFIYVWSKPWNELSVSRKEAKKASQGGGTGAQSGIFRVVDTEKTMEHYKVKKIKEDK